MNLRNTRLAMRLLGATVACAPLAACVGNPFAYATIDSRSPIAAEVASTVRPNASFPTFKTIPPVPTDVRPHLQYGEQATGVEKIEADLVAATADSTWTLSNTDAFADQVRAEVGPLLPPANPADTIAFAKDQKARATAPPPPKR